jgi:hypothetical protein
MISKRIGVYRVMIGRILNVEQLAPFVNQLSDLYVDRRRGW